MLSSSAQEKTQMQDIEIGHRVRASNGRVLFVEGHVVGLERSPDGTPSAVLIRTDPRTPAERVLVDPCFTLRTLR